MSPSESDVSRSTQPGIDLLQWKSILDARGVDSSLQALANSLRSEKKFHQLFEVEQMRVRHKLGLAMHRPPRLEALRPSQQDALEKGLLEACRTVGFALLDEGEIGEAWMYLRALGDKRAIAERLRSVAPAPGDDTLPETEIEAASERMEQAIHVALYEGVDPTWGIEQMLQHHGICNSVTAVSGLMAHWDRETRHAVSAVLVNHLHSELVENLLSDVAHRQRTPPEPGATDGPPGPIARILDAHPDLLAEQAHHIDLSHLMSIVQFARNTTDRFSWNQALDLAAYGQRLAPQLVSAGDAPFERFYPMHHAWFAVLLGIRADENLQPFEQAARTTDRETRGSFAAETYVDLLDRMGRHQAAAQASVTLLPPGTPVMGIAPPLLELSESAGDFSAHVSAAESRNDLLGYAQGILAQHPENGHKTTDNPAPSPPTGT